MATPVATVALLSGFNDDDEGSESIYVAVLAMLFLAVVSVVMLVVMLLTVLMKRQTLLCSW
ncbi:hypothetical protein HanPI659440_Chr06g0246871 [Helianthus annuus]|nr:hypothetical protein HanPI659440_Chr06g0246871 [Helianthus annuus]